MGNETFNGMTKSIKISKFWVPLGTGYRENFRSWVAMGTGYRPEKLIRVPAKFSTMPSPGFDHKMRNFDFWRNRL